MLRIALALVERYRLAQSRVNPDSSVIVAEAHDLYLRRAVHRGGPAWAWPRCLHVVQASAVLDAPAYVRIAVA
jgi:hypothetical protein